VPPSPSRKSFANLHAPRPAAPSLEGLLGLIADAASAQDLDAALRTARAHYAGSMMEQLERAAAERAHFLLATLDGTEPDA
jgi:hypothetical protein